MLLAKEFYKKKIINDFIIWVVVCMLNESDQVD